VADRTAVLLVDDHPVLRAGLARLLEGEPDLIVCGEAENAETALAAADRLRPALAVVDLSMHGQSSIELIRRLRTNHPELRVLVLSMHDESTWAARVLQAGASGYVMKQDDPKVLIDRIRQVLRGETAVSPAIAATLLRELTWGRNPAKPAVGEDRLGDREQQVLRLLGQGKSTREIAADLHISVKTVDAHREHIKQKLGLSSAAELIRYAVLKVERDPSPGGMKSDLL
jgi:DNA-binding NarL/FixJ family response regulator